MKVLAVQETDWFKRGPHQQHHIFEGLAKRGHEIRVMHFPLLWRSEPKEGLFQPGSIEHGVHRTTDDGGVAVITPSFLRLELLDLPSMAFSHYRAVRQEIRRFNPDVVVGLSILNSWMALRCARKEGIPFVYYIIDVLYELVPWNYLRGVARQIEEFNLRHADLVIGINQTLLDLAVHRGAPKERCRLVRAGVDLDRFKPGNGSREIGEQLGLFEADVVIGFVGWVYDFVKLDTLLPGIQVAKTVGVEVKLLVVGEGEGLGRLLHESETRGLRSNVVVTGWVPYRDVPAYLDACDIVVYPAAPGGIVNHIVPIKFYECLAMGKPVIATPLPGLVTEFQSGRGVVFASGGDEIVRIAIGLRDSRSYTAVSEAAVSFVNEHCHWEKQVGRFEECLNAVQGPR